MFDRKKWKKAFYQKNKELLREKSLKSFNKRKANGEAKIIADKHADWVRKQIELDPHWNRRRNLKKKYNISLEKWDEMFKQQNNCCAICKAMESNARFKAWHTDHCHISNKIRGILCHSCNTTLGHVKEDIKILETMIEYLRRHAID